MEKYHLRRKEKVMEENEIIQILKRNMILTIALCKNNTPYLVTMDYAFNKQKVDYVLITNNDIKADYKVISALVKVAEITWRVIPELAPTLVTLVNRFPLIESVESSVTLSVPAQFAPISLKSQGSNISLVYSTPTK